MAHDHLRNSQQHHIRGLHEHWPSEVLRLDCDRIGWGDEQRANAPPRENLPPIRVQADDGAVVIERLPDVRKEPTVDKYWSCRRVPN
jgi:hypothetical protein